MKSFTKLILTLILVTGLSFTQSCAFFTKSEFTEITAQELTALVDTFPDAQKRQIAQTKAVRDQIINNFKTPFALAQAAEAEGLQKTDDFKQQIALATTQLVATEYTKRNPDVTVTKEERDAYYNAHKSQFDTDFALITKNARQMPSESDKEAMRDQWAELNIRAEKGRQTGIEKELGVQVQIKLRKASALADAYTKSLEEKFKLTPEEKKRYIAEHPEADIEKIKEKADALLARLKKGEDFEKIAKEFNEDDTRANGGELPWFSKDGKMDGGATVDENFAQAAFALEKGQFSNEVIKTQYGFHIIKVDDKRKVDPAAAPKPAASPAADGANGQPAASPTPQEPQEQVRTRHIYLSTAVADRFEQEEIEKKIKRAMEDATLKYPVKVPADFAVNVSGFDPNRIPGLGGGQGGTMKGIDPNANK
ncbi:MAG: peptidylprolyl isomerase [Blastocatellales bacterium]